MSALPNAIDFACAYRADAPAAVGAPALLSYCGDCHRQRIRLWTPPHQIARGHVVECGCGELLVALDIEKRAAKAALANAVTRHLF